MCHNGYYQLEFCALKLKIKLIHFINRNFVINKMNVINENTP